MFINFMFAENKLGCEMIMAYPALEMAGANMLIACGAGLKIGGRWAERAFWVLVGHVFLQ
jgi:hypothetical protein